MGKQEIEAIPGVMDLFGLEKTEIVRDLEGLANHNYLVTTTSGQEYVVKFLREETEQKLENEVAIQPQLARVGLLSPIYLESKNGKRVYKNREIRAVVSVKIEGVKPERTDRAFLFEAGKALAKFHTGVTSLVDFQPGWLNQKVVKALTEDEELEIVVKARRWFEEGLEIYNYPLPSGIIHGNFQEGNLLIANPNQPVIKAVFDFEETEENLFLVDMARSILAMCRSANNKRLDVELVKTFLNGYQMIRTLTGEEKRMLPLAQKYVQGAVIIWLVKHNLTDSCVTLTIF